MNTTQNKTSMVLILLTSILFSTALTGCGDSQGVTALNSHLVQFSEMIESYKSTVSSDHNTQAEWDAKIDTMAAKWTDMRNAYGSEVTPQKMDELVKKYDSLMLTLQNFKKAIGS